MIQLDDCDVYIIAFESNDSSFGDNSFASLTPEEIEHIYNLRHDRSLRDLTRDEVQSIMDDWITGGDAYIDQSEDWHRRTPSCSGNTVEKVEP